MNTRHTYSRITLVALLFFGMSMIVLPGSPTAVMAVPPDCNTGTGAGVFHLGDGTPGDPYQVTNSAQLAAIGTLDCLPGSFLQSADITLAGAWTPIGSAATPFMGTYDGGGHSISGLTVNGTSEVGLFGVLNAATVQNLHVAGSVTASAERAGLIAGRSSSAVISYVTVSGSVAGTSDVGGLIGRVQEPGLFIGPANSDLRTNFLTASVHIIAVSNFADVTASASNGKAGGLAGSVNGTVAITSSANHGPVTSVMGSASAGGFVGLISGNATISASTNHARIVGGNDVGGFLGRQQGDLIADTLTNDGEVSTTSTNAGGLVGRLEGTAIITSSMNRATVSGDSMAGGLVGNLYQSIIATNSANHGDVTATSPFSFAGGLVGNLGQNAIITDGTNTGEVSGGGTAGGFIGATGGSAFLDTLANHGAVTGSSADAGGLIGFTFVSASITNSINNGDVTGGDNAGGLLATFLTGATVNASVNHGTVTGTHRVGGIASQSSGGLTLLDSYSTGAVTATVSDAGGISATLGGDSLTNVYASGSVTATGQAGALVASATGSTISAAFFDSARSSTSTGPGTDTSLTRFSTFANAGWKITSGWTPYAAGVKVWGMCSSVNSGRPFLLWEYTTTPCVVALPATPTVTTVASEDPRAISGLIAASAVVFLVAADAPVDAVIAASAGGAMSAPVLTADIKQVDEPTLAEMRRLGSQRIVLIGGDQRLSSGLEEQLANQTPGLTVERVAGADRIHTAVEVSRRFHPAGAARVMVVAADASADAVVAAAQRSPVLFTHRNEIPKVTVDEIERLNPAQIVVVGGSTRIADSVMTTMAARFPSAQVQRRGGADRFATSALLADPRASEVVLVHGDLRSIGAFTAPALAARSGRTLLFSRSDCAPDSVHGLLAARSVINIGALSHSSCS